MLACIHESESIKEDPSLEEILDGMNGEQLRLLLHNLAENNPDLLNQIEIQVNLLFHPDLHSQKGAPHKRRSPVNVTLIRGQARNILHSLDHMRPSEAYWQVGNVLNQLRQLLDQVWSFVEGGDGNNAINILEAITDEYVQCWYTLDGSDGTTGEFFDELGSLWVEAILCAELNRAERKSLDEKLIAWQDDVDDYGVESVFDAARAAAFQGWDHPSLLRVLHGEITNGGPLVDEASWCADELVLARLNILERQERYQEYLYLAEAESQIALYLTMLVRLGRIDEAIAYSREYLTSTDEAMALVQALRGAGKIDDALEIAEIGLTLQGSKLQLASWLRELASQAGNDALALQAAVITYEESPTLESYLRTQDLAGEHWSQVKQKFLDRLTEKPWGASTKVDIYLHEGMLDEAMRVVDDESPYYATLERVVDAVLESHPMWATRHCKAQAEEIMDAGRSDLYHHAVKWLLKTRTAYYAAGRQSDWKAYLDTIIQTHKRKYKLRPMLESLA
jgi:uncharacterized Zn finger protein